MSSLTRYPLLARPHIRLIGAVDINMYLSFRSVMNNPPQSDLVLALTTLGGDPEVARAMGEDIRLHGEQTGFNALFLGKVAVYSAGATLMSYFRRENRFLTHGTRLLIHERQIDRKIHMSGPLRSCVAQLRAALHEIEESIRIEDEGFANIVDQSAITLEQVRDLAPNNWYIDAQEAKRLGLVLDVI
jgi:ATP-dependent protease ClpP protease subunit